MLHPRSFRLIQLKHQQNQEIAMYMYTVGHSRLISTGAYIPETKVTSRELMQLIDSKNRFGLSPDWLERTTGIRERRVAPDDLLPSDLAVSAAREALERAAMTPNDVDAIIFTGVFRDYLEPATAHVVMQKLGATNAVAFDVTNACHGFVNGIHLMDALIATGQVRRGLVVTGEPSSRLRRKTIEMLSNSHDRDLFMKLASGLTLGDSGAAAVIGPKLDPDSGFVGFMLESQGDYYAYSVYGRNGTADSPLEAEMIPLIKEGVRMLSGMYPHFMEKVGWKPSQIAKCAQHQASRTMIKQFASYIGIDPSITVDSVSTMGNLITGNVPINLHMMKQTGEVKTGDKVLIVGGGSGIAVSHVGLVWDAA
jgi:acyl-CoA:acyl-CoA alkyltransferase